MNARSRADAKRAARASSALVLLLGLVIVSFARADGRASFLAERLKFPPAAGQADDFRVRTNAALALGATNSDDAVGPLCAALADPSEIVRQAVAVALKRLARKSSLECLKRANAAETHAAVKQQISRAIAALDAPSALSTGKGSVAAPSYVPNARFYVSLARVTNQSSRDSEEVNRVVNDAVVSKLREIGGYQLAPEGESNAAARATVKKRALKGYYLATSVDHFDYSGDQLRVRVKIAVFSYPGKDLRGEVPSSGTISAQAGDKAAEDEIMAAVAARAAELFTQSFQ